MAAPTVRGVGAYGSGGGGSFIAAVPTGGSAPVAGDAMYIIMESSDSNTTAGTPNTPGGWSKLFEQTFAAGSSVEPAVSTLTIFGKIAGAGEANVTVDGVGEHCSGAMIVIAGHGLSVIGDTVVGTAADHGTTQANNLAPSITVSANSLIILAIGLGDDANDTTNVSGVVNANLASITERIDQTTNAASGGGVSIYTATCAGTTTGTTEWDHDTAAQSESLHLGIKPALLSITAAPGSFSEGGVAATIVAGRLLSGVAGTYAESGFSATLVTARVLSAEIGGFAEGGVAATLVAGRAIGAEPGSFLLTGVNATLVVGTSEKFINADPGSFLQSGVNSSLIADRALSADTGAYILGGIGAKLVPGWAVLANPGNFALSGVAAATAADRFVSASPGVFGLSGVAATFAVERALLAGVGTFVESGFSATLLHSAAGGSPPRNSSGSVMLHARLEGII